MQQPAKNLLHRIVSSIPRVLQNDNKSLSLVGNCESNMVETPLRRSRRTLTQSDDEQSVASSVASATRSTRRTRSSSEASNNDDASVDAPTRRTRSASNASAASSTATPTRRTRSSSNVSSASNATPTKRARGARSKVVTELDVIPEVIETDGGDATAASKDTGDNPITGSKKKRSRKGSAETPKKDEKKAKTTPQKKQQSSKHELTPVSKKSPSRTETPKKKDEKKAKTTPQKKQQSSKHELTPVSKKSPSRITPSTSPKLTMDVNVHRLRFLKLNPKSILAMSSTPTGAPDEKSSLSPQRLAVSREGGSVELLSPQDRWVSVGTVPGVRGRDVDALVWLCGKHGTESKSGGDMMRLDHDDHSHLTRNADEQRRLFGCSRDGTIFELDFAKKRHKSVMGSGGGGVFCLASLCSRGKCCCSGGSCGGYFAAGCEDGSVRIYRASNRGDSFPELVSTLPSAGNAILSIAWVAGQSSYDDGGMGGSVLFAGVADGTIRRYDCNTSRVLGAISTGSVLASSKNSSTISYRWNSTLRMTVENRGLQEATKVWALAALSDGTVVSGDSLGHVQIWDGTSGTMTQTFDHNESGADVLCLAVSDDENKIFAGGIDPRVQCIQRQCLPPSSSNNQEEPNLVRKWINAQANRKHTHDVKALAICHKSTSQGSNELLVSGSVDTRICMYSAGDFRSSRPKIWYNWPSVSPVSISRKQRLLAVTRDDRVDLYRLDASSSANSVTILRPEARDETKCLVKSLHIKSSFNLVCSVISDDGAFLAASDASSLYLFSLEVDNESGIIEDVRPSKIDLDGKCKQPCTALRFDGFGRLICATADGPINVLRVSPDEVSLDHVFKEHISGLSASSHHFPVSSLDVSVDGKWLAAERFASGKGAVHVFTLPTKKGGHYQHWWPVPEMEVPTTSIKFLGRGGDESSLCVGYSNNAFNIFNLESRSISQWNTDMGFPLVKSLPRELTSRSEPVTRIVCNPTSPQKLILVCECCKPACVLDWFSPVLKSLTCCVAHFFFCFTGSSRIFLSC